MILPLSLRVDSHHPALTPSRLPKSTETPSAIWGQVSKHRNLTNTVHIQTLTMAEQTNFEIDYLVRTTIVVMKHRD